MRSRETTESTGSLDFSTDPDRAVLPEIAARVIIALLVKLPSMPPRSIRSAIARSALSTFALAAGGVASVALCGPRATDDTGEALFTKSVLPLLDTHCFKCHGPNVARPKGGLRFADADSLKKGGDSGAVVVPFEPAKSLLVKALKWTDESLEMPPKQQLAADEIAVIEQWIELGAPWPTALASNTASNTSSESEIDIAKGREWWAYRPVVAPAVPTVKAEDRVVKPLDAFVLAKLEAKGLMLAEPAAKATLARRVYFDLIGLPPSAEEIDRFVLDPAPDAYARLVDDLLSRPEYGERWARHWLDVVRYAETSGYERDQEKPFAWRYRDYVVDSFNQDKPWDRFVLEQLAGDELDAVTKESIVATGIYRLGPWDSEPDDMDQAEFDELDDMVRTIGEGFLGTTIGCARCHDHKFDPIPQTDYYGLLAFLRNLRRYDDGKFAPDSPTLAMLSSDPAAMKKWNAEREERKKAIESEAADLVERARTLVIEERAKTAKRLKDAWDTPEKDRNAKQREIIDAVKSGIDEQRALNLLDSKDHPRAIQLLGLQRERLTIRESFQGHLDWALCARENTTPPPVTHLLVRGQASSPAEEVAPHFPRALAPSDDAAMPSKITRSAHAESSGRRRVLAEWIANSSNPLTARVIVNRVWQHHFGEGIVPTPNDFGKAGAPPTNPELLDHLASEFVKHGESLKWLHREILLSSTYRQDSTVDDAVAKRASLVDPGNQLLWRQNRHRLEAETLRDSILAASGSLVTTRGGPSFFEPLPREALAGLSRPGEGMRISPAAETQRRSLYAFVKRNLLTPLLETFDCPNSALPEGRRAVTTVPTQALQLLNGDFAGRQSEAFASRVLADAKGDTSRAIELVFERALSRKPTPSELTAARAFVERETAAVATRAPSTVIESLVPPRLERGFLAILAGDRILRAPADTFEVLKGRFGNDYNVTYEVDRLEGPCALWKDHELVDGEVAARFEMHEDSPYCGLLVRGKVDGDVAAGIEVRIEPPSASSPGALILLSHDNGVATELARRAAAIRTLVPVELVVSLAGAKVHAVISQEGQPPISLEGNDGGTPATRSGRVGIKTYGSGITLERLAMSSGKTTIEAALPRVDSAQHAMAALALTIMNLNEFLYID